MHVIHGIYLGLLSIMPGPPQAYFNVAMNQQSVKGAAADVDAPGNSSAVSTQADGVVVDVPGAVTTTVTRSQSEQSPSGYVQKTMDRTWTKISV